MFFLVNSYLHFRKTNHKAMKKIFLLTLITILSIGYTMAQVDTIFYESFANGLNPAWGNNGTSGGGANPWVQWIYTTTGAKDAYDNGATMTSPTAGNGYIIFDSDSLDNGAVAGAFGLGPAPAPQVVQLTTTGIDVSTTPYCRLSFFQFYRNLESTTAVGISTDSVNWTMDTINTTIGLNENTASNSKITIDLSSVILATSGGPNKVYIRFFMNAYYYFWMIDDITITTLPDNDLQVNYSFGEKGSSGLWYSSIPLSQFTSTDSFAAVTNYSNIGQVTQTNINTDFTLYNGSSLLGSLAGSPVVAALPYGGDTTVLPASEFGTTGLGKYTVAIDVVATDSANFEPTNLDSIKFTVSDSVFSIVSSLEQVPFSGYYLLEQNEGISFNIGALYEVTDADTVTSVTTAVSGGAGNSAPGTIIQASIYPVTLSNNSSGQLIANYTSGSPQVSTFSKTLVAGDLTDANATNVTPIVLPINNSTGNAILVPGVYWVSLGSSYSPDSDVVIPAMADVQLGGFAAAPDGTNPSTQLDAFNSGVPYCTMNFGHSQSLLYANWTRSPNSNVLKVGQPVTFQGHSNGSGATVYNWTIVDSSANYQYPNQTGGTVKDTFENLTNNEDSFYVCVTATDEGYTTLPYCKYVLVRQLGVGINNIAPLSELTLVPNPTTGHITINADGVEGLVSTTVIDLLGNVVKSFSNESNGTFTQSYDLSSLTSGMYIIKIENQGAVVTKKLSISKQ